MYKRFQEIGRPITFSFNGAPVEAQQGDTIAAALLMAGLRSFRKTPVSGTPRGAFCMMGACFDCLVEIDGETVQACMVPASEGLIVTSPRAPAKFAGNER